VVLPTQPASVRFARTFAADAVAHWGVAVDIAAVKLATTEIVTNALVHAYGEVALTVRFDHDMLRVEVTDASPQLPVVHDPAPMSISGRGMAIVEAVTDKWGVEMVPDGGKVVWFAVSAHR
jgi:anti-sigma regulatory factor (Ser/Thr protein kinase)